jgi:hypothetical protein
MIPEAVMPSYSEKDADDLSMSAVVPLLSHRCYTVITPLLHCCYSVVTVLLQRCYSVVTVLLRSCYTVGEKDTDGTSMSTPLTYYNTITARVCVCVCVRAYMPHGHELLDRQVYEACISYGPPSTKTVFYNFVGMPIWPPSWAACVLAQLLRAGGRATTRPCC